MLQTGSEHLAFTGLRLCSSSNRENSCLMTNLRQLSSVKIIPFLTMLFSMRSIFPTKFKVVTVVVGAGAGVMAIPDRGLSRISVRTPVQIPMRVQSQRTT